MPRRDAIALGLILAVAVAARAVLLLAGVAEFDGDEAITALMAQRILDGEHFVYYAGQRYLGSAEQYLQAAAFAALPDTPFTSRVPMLVLAGITCTLVYALGRAVTESRRAGLFAASLFAVGPLWGLLLTAKNRGAYAIGLLVGAAGLVLALRSEATTRPRLLAVGLGLCCGLGFWNNWMAAYLLVPAVLWWLGVRRNRAVAPLVAAVAGFVAGALPALAEAVRHGLPTVGGVHPDSSVAERAAATLGDAVPVFLGLRARGQVPLVPPVVEWTVVVAVAAALLAAVVVRRRGLGRLLSLRPEGRRPGDLLLLTVLLGLALAILSPTSWYGDDPRYLSPLYVVTPVLLASAATLLRSPRAAAAAGVVLLLTAITATVAGGITLQRRGGEGDDVAGTPVRYADVVAVAEHLRAAGVPAAYGDYWIAQPVQFAAGDDIVVAPLGSDRFDARSRIDTEASAAWIVPSTQGDALTEALTATGRRFRRADVGPWTVIDQLDPPLHP